MRKWQEEKLKQLREQSLSASQAQASQKYVELVTCSAQLPCLGLFQFKWWLREVDREWALVMNQQISLPLTIKIAASEVVRCLYLFESTKLVVYADIWCFFLSFFNFFCMPCMEYEAITNSYLAFYKQKYFWQLFWNSRRPQDFHLFNDYRPNLNFWALDFVDPAVLSQKHFLLKL